MARARAATEAERRLLGCNLPEEVGSCQYPGPPTPGPQGADKSDGVGAPAEPVGRKAKLPRAGPGVVPGLCRPLYRLLCGDSEEGKLSLGVTTCRLPSSLLLLFLLHPPPIPSPLTEVPSPPRAPTRPGGRSGLRPSVARYRGGGVLTARWLGEKMGCPRPGGETQGEKGGCVTHQDQSPGSLCPSALPTLAAPKAHPGVESEAGGCVQTGPPLARQGHSPEWRVGPGMTALRPTSQGPPAVDRQVGQSVSERRSPLRPRPKAGVALWVRLC